MTCYKFECSHWWKNYFKTSLKSQKFTWPLACVYISFVKLKNICSWFFSVLFKNLKDISMILHDFLCFIQDLECSIIFKKISMFYYILKNIFKIFEDFSCLIQDLEQHSWFIIDFHEIFKIFQDYSCFIKDLEWFLIYEFYSLRIHVSSQILMISSRFFRIFQDFSCFIQDLEWYLTTF